MTGLPRQRPIYLFNSFVWVAFVWLGIDIKAVLVVFAGADETGSEKLRFVVFVEHAQDNTLYSRKKTA